MNDKVHDDKNKCNKQQNRTHYCDIHIQLNLQLTHP